MARHRRQIIRQAVVARLQGQTAAGPRVYGLRVLPWHRLELPAIAVYTPGDTTDKESIASAPRELTRSLQLFVEAAVRYDETGNVDDAIDSICAEIERALHGDETFGAVCSDSYLASTELDLTVEGEKPHGWARLTYEVTYITGAPEAEDVTLPAFDRATIRQSLAGEQAAADQAQDSITLPGT